MKIKYKAKVGYNGCNYHGWAKQPNTLTIQGILEDTIYKVFNQRVSVFGAGRTDAGVNAAGQVVHFDLKEIKVKSKQIMCALNKALPYDIRILTISKTNNKFNARFNAKNKTYVYAINTGKVNPIQSSFIYQYNKPLNIKSLKQLAKLFVGKHNFLSFSTDARELDSTTRTINKISISSKNNIINISVNGDGFLRSQIRMIVGTMIAFNEGKITQQQIKKLFEQPKKGGATFKAPACGLTLFKVTY